MLLHNVPLLYYQNKHPHRAFISEPVRYYYRAYALVSTDNEEVAGRKPKEYGCRMSAPIAALASTTPSITAVSMTLSSDRVISAAANRT